MTEIKTDKPYCFVDATGGALAWLGATLARSLGHEDAVATTLGQTHGVPEEVSLVLEEIAVGASGAGARTLDEETAKTHAIVWLGDGAPPKTNTLVAGARSVACKLLASDAGELERLCTARIARDRIERFVESARG